MSKVKLAAVSYLNTRPFLYGLRHSEIIDQIELSLEMPSQCATQLLNDKVDGALVPVAVLLEDSELKIFSDYCIGSNGDVGSVKLYSQVPLAELKKVFLDYQSQTSVLLAQVLATHYWDIQPEWVTGLPGFENHIEGTTGGVVIGDRTFDLEEKFKYRYDLSSEWKRFSGMPFVFAVWAARKPLPTEFVASFNGALDLGLRNMAEVKKKVNSETGRDMDFYFESNLSYQFDAEKKKALDHFLALAGAIRKENVST